MKEFFEVTNPIYMLAISYCIAIAAAYGIASASMDVIKFIVNPLIKYRKKKSGHKRIEI